MMDGVAEPKIEAAELSASGSSPPLAERDLARLQGIALEANAPLSYLIANLTFALEELASIGHQMADADSRDDAATRLTRAESGLRVVVDALHGARQGADRMGQLLRSVARSRGDAPLAVGPSSRPGVKSRARVLVVDDEPMMVRAIARLLESDLEILSTTDPGDAIARIRGGQRFEVILCDLMMPTLSGIEVYEAIRAIDAPQARRVVFMTGGAFTPHVCQFLDTTENARIEKPVEREALLAIVRGLVS